MKPMYYSDADGWKFRPYYLAQIEHIKTHQAEFEETTGHEDVESYFRDYVDEDEALYWRLCQDMEIVPIENLHDVLEPFVRATNSDGTIQIGFVDPALPYADRPVDIQVVSKSGALKLISELAGAAS